MRTPAVSAPARRTWFIRLPRLALVVLFAAFAATACGPAPAGTQTAETFHSEALGRTMRYRVFVPGGAGPHPVVYLLHGHGGDEGNWFDHSGVVAEAQRHGLAVVTPDGGNSWYVNSATERWEDYIAHDLAREVEGRFPVARAREGRAIAGLSMGGYGAVKIALRYPGRFVFAASTSGAFDTTRATSVFSPRGTSSNVLEVFGPPGSVVRRENDVYRMAAEVSDPSVLPYLRIDCGTDDPWFGINEEMAAALYARGIAHDFIASPGHHNWPYWNRSIVDIMAEAARRLR